MEINPVILAKSVAIETIPLIVVVVDILVTTLTTKMQLLMLITLRLVILKIIVQVLKFLLPTALMEVPLCHGILTQQRTITSPLI